MPDGVLALIPARGGSKGIPRKNIMSLAGKPMIAYSILQAIESARLDRVIVSTDDPEIVSLATLDGHDVHHRGPELADVPVDEVVAAVCDWAVVAAQRFKAVLLVRLWLAPALPVL